MPDKKENFSNILRKILTDKKLLGEFLKDPSVLNRFGLELNKTAVINIQGRVDKLLKEGLTTDEIIKKFYVTD